MNPSPIFIAVNCMNADILDLGTVRHPMVDRDMLVLIDAMWAKCSQMAAAPAAACFGCGGAEMPICYCSSGSDGAKAPETDEAHVWYGHIRYLCIHFSVHRRSKLLPLT